MDKTSTNMEVKVSSGRKILVPTREQITLPDGRKVWISKIVPGNFLVKSVLYDSNPSRDENKEGNALEVYERKLAIADNYEEALPISTEHRRCALCQKPKCSTIVRASGVELTSEICPKGLFLYGSICIKHDLEFVNVRYVKIPETALVQPPDRCWICKAPKPKLEKLSLESDPSDYEKAMADNIDFLYLLVALTDGILYHCLNCGFVLDTESNTVSLPIKNVKIRYASHIKDKK